MLQPSSAKLEREWRLFWARFADEFGDIGDAPSRSGTPASATSPSVPVTSAT